MADVDTSARYRRLGTFSVLGVIILGLCACNNLLPGNLLADLADRRDPQEVPYPQEMPGYDYNELDDRSCPALVGDVVGDSQIRSTSCFMATTAATDKRLLALIVKDIAHEQQLASATDREVSVVWVQFDHPGDDNFEGFATGFYFEDKDDAGFVLSEEDLQRATVVNNVYVVEGALNFY